MIEFYTWKSKENDEQLIASYDNTFNRFPKWNSYITQFK